MLVNSINQIARRLTAAEGYLELGLPVDAQDELQRIDDPAPFLGPYMWLMGESLRNQGMYDEAIAPLRHAARELPVEISQRAWEALKDCLEKSGRSAAAEDMSRTMEYLEQRNDVSSSQACPPQSPSNIRVDLPLLGKLQISFDNKDGLTIKVMPVSETPE